MYSSLSRPFHEPKFRARLDQLQTTMPVVSSVSDHFWCALVETVIQLSQQRFSLFEHIDLSQGHPNSIDVKFVVQECITVNLG